MSILRLSTLSLTLAIAVFSLGYVDSASADPKDCGGEHCVGHGGDSDGEKNLQARFDLTIVPTTTLACDSGCEYQDSSRDHVGVFTGSGPGFRFDTNLQNGNKMSRFESARLVYIDFPDKDIAAYEIDFRFQNPGLDLGSLEVNEEGRVAVALFYYGGNQVVGFDALNYGVLAFGDLNAPINDPPDCLDNGEILVTRTDDKVWTLESVSAVACRFATDANGDIECTRSNSCRGGQPVIVPIKFEFTLVRQD